MARLSVSEVELRLEEDKDDLESYFYPEKFRKPLRENVEPRFEREVKFKNGDVYELRVCITEGYPDVLPDLVVSKSPQPMPSTRLWCGSHAMHTCPRRSDGLLRICHFHPHCWTRENKIYEVFKKGKKWLKVYVLRHLVRRKPMNFYLPEMVPTQEEMMIAAARMSRRLQASQRAILNNPMSSPEPLFLHQMVREFILKLTVVPDVERKILIEWSPCLVIYLAARSRVEAGPRAIMNGPTVSADALSPYQMVREFFSGLNAIPYVERIKLIEWNQYMLANMQF